jgi:gas vesicle protein
MNAHTQGHPNSSFLIGLVTGTFVGAAVAMWFAPRAGSELRQQMTDSARILGQRASEQYRQASTRVSETVDQLTRQGESVRDDVAEAVARGAHEVERLATAVRSDRVTKASEPSVADLSASKPHSL